MQGTNSQNSFQILLVEDSPSDAALLQENMLLGGVKDTGVRVAQSLHEAVDYLKSSHVDAVLLDLTLPDSSGLDTVREISRIAPDLPVVVLTGIDDEKTGIEAVRMGVQDYLVKGRADGRTILRAIRYSIERKQMDNALRQGRDELEQKVQERTAEIAQTLVILRRQQTRDAVTRVLLELFAQKTSMTDYLDSVVKVICTWSGCRCVGIRLTDSEGYIPYESCVGFSEEFVSAESRLCLNKDVCACIRVVAQAPDPQDAGVMTDKGSFRCENTFRFIDSLTAGEKARYRGNCLKHGFASVAVVPIRYRDRIFGAVHMADEQPNKVPLESVQFLENMAGLIGEAVHRFRIEQALRLSESRLVEAQRIAHLGNWDWDIVRNMLWWSDEVYRIFGLQPQQFGATYEAFLCHVHADDRDLVKSAVNEALHNHRPYSIDHRVIRPGGSQRIVHERAEVFYDSQNKPIRMMGTVQDVTELKQAEERILADQMTLRSLASELQLAEERERRRIAGDLHDSIGQILALSKWELVRLQRSVPPEAAASMKELANQLDKAIKQARTLSFELSPSILYDLGFEVALEDLAERFSKERKIKCKFQSRAGREPLPDAVKILLYRSVRELLINVAKHANATTVKLSLDRIDNNLHITVEDNGDGFDVSILNSQSRRPKGFGVLSIQERLKHIGGHFEIQSNDGKGTKVILVAPAGIPENMKRDRL